MKKLITALAFTVALFGVTPILAAEHHGSDQRRMERMDNMMDRAQGSDASDRHRLLREHMGLMMQQMQGMMESAKDNDGKLQDERLSMMEERMQMMQKMMDQMLRHQQMMLESTDDEEGRE